MNIQELPTPSAVIDLDRLEKNIRNMAERAKGKGIKLRPHIKTHKMPVIARMQLDMGAVGITCAKVTEAEVMIKAGIKDILIAFPVIGDFQIQKIMEFLDAGCKMTIAFDSSYGAQKLHEAAMHNGKVLDLYMIINTGGDRDGVKPGEEALQLAQQIRQLSHVKIKGIMTHEGHVRKTNNLEELKAVVIDAGRKMVETAELLRENGFPIEEVSMGTTPACRADIAVKGITEWRPGTYVFNDAHEILLVTSVEECAVSIIATVVSHPAPDRFILDSGSKTLTSDKPSTNGYGYIKQAPHAVIDRLNEEHGVVISQKEDDLYIGQRVEIIPNHVCPVINLMDKVYVVRGDQVVDEWKVEARGKIH
jgi:D-serine deaminase-like pyridoxal phosphate-dependent protein